MAVAEIEVLDRAPTLEELAETANRGREAVREKLIGALDDAFRVGDALLAAKEQVRGEFNQWLKANVEMSRAEAYLYIRLAFYREAILENVSEPSIRQARLFVRGLPDLAPRTSSQVTAKRAEGMRLLSQGVPPADVAEMLGVHWSTVRNWTIDPEESNRRAHERRERARKAKEQERDRNLKRALVKAGEATNEAWNMAERFQDVIAQAQRETEDREAREALSLAGKHSRKMRDEIVRALGVS